MTETPPFATGVDAPGLAPRYAAYFAPAFDSPWWQAGSHWLGRCAVRGRVLAQPAVPGLAPAEVHRLTDAPRRYGWHATLRAPFALAPGVDLAALRARLRKVCRSRQPFELPELKVVLLDDFLALAPRADSGDERANGGLAAIDAVARACVTGLHDLAAPPTPAESQRRRAGGLSTEEDALMLRWGYPYVMECFRFHFSLTGLLHGVAPARVQALRAAAESCFATLPVCRFQSVALFAEPAAGADFLLVEQVALGSPGAA